MHSAQASLEHEVMLRQLSMQETSSNSWISQLRRILFQYKLLCPIPVANNPPEESRWKNSQNGQHKPLEQITKGRCLKNEIPQVPQYQHLLYWLLPSSWGMWAWPPASHHDSYIGRSDILLQATDAQEKAPTPLSHVQVKWGDNTQFPPPQSQAKRAQGTAFVTDGTNSPDTATHWLMTWLDASSTLHTMQVMRSRTMKASPEICVTLSTTTGPCY